MTNLFINCSTVCFTVTVCNCMNVVKDEVQDCCSLCIFVDYFGRARRQRSIGQPKLGARIETFISNSWDVRSSKPILETH